MVGRYLIKKQNVHLSPNDKLVILIPKSKEMFTIPPPIIRD